MKELMNRVNHQQASQLLHNKFVVVLGDSIQRAVYKDIVLLLQKDRYLSAKQLKTKGEMSFEQDILLEGGCLNEMHNGTEYREVRQFRTDHHLVRFYFVTRIYSHYMQTILQDFRHSLKPDVVIVNSCVWDISRYLSNWIEDYKKNLHRFFVELKEALPDESLVIWNLTMPLAERLKGGFLVPEIEHKAPQLRHDVIEANFYSGTLADCYGMDVLDLHFHFRFSLQHRATDGVHWNALAHRRITFLLLQHSAQAWGVIMPCPPTTVEEVIKDRQLSDENKNKAADQYQSERSDHLKVEVKNQRAQKRHRQRSGGGRSARPPPPFNRQKHRYNRHGYNHEPPHYFQPYVEHHYPYPHYHDEYHHHHEYHRHYYNHDHRSPPHSYVMRNRYNRHHYTPYTHYRPSRYGPYGHYY